MFASKDESSLQKSLMKVKLDSSEVEERKGKYWEIKVKILNTNKSEVILETESGDHNTQVSSDSGKGTLSDTEVDLNLPSDNNEEDDEEVEIGTKIPPFISRFPNRPMSAGAMTAPILPGAHAPHFRKFFQYWMLLKYT